MQVFEIEPPGLSGENPANIVELPLRDASTIAIPNQLCKDDAFTRRRRNLQNPAIGESQFRYKTTGEPDFVIGVDKNRENIELLARSVVPDVRPPASASWRWL